MYQFKAKYSELKQYSLYLSNISIDFTINSIKKTRSKEYLKCFLMVFDFFYTKDIMDIHKHLIICKY